MSSEDHLPAAGCNYNQCGLGDPLGCPFTRDEPQPAAAPANECAHEWRQVSTQSPQLDLRFFCVHCLTIKKTS